MRDKTSASLVAASILCGAIFGVSSSASGKALPAGKVSAEGRKDLELFKQLLTDSEENAVSAIDQIEKQWKPSYAAPMIEFLNYSRSSRIRKILEDKTKKGFGVNQNSWYHWLWSQEDKTGDFHADFKALLYSNMDPQFSEYFEGNPKSTIRLDEVRWGGVRRDGIPPLKNPKMISVAEAGYLDDDNVVFGVSINGDARAYPKRVLAWHEMFKDKVGGVEVNGVYCTLCGSMILYDTNFKGKHYELGTSGFLYRSNKLMYDHGTKSMWSTIEGKPVIGKLVGKGIQLKPLYVVTSTWGKWKEQHPDTKVLSLDTGHRRDYGEGVAYKDYFSTDKLMFTVPKLDKRLKNKQEVLAIRFGGVADKPLAFTASYLKKHPIYHGTRNSASYVILTDEAGANRVYEAPSGNVKFVKFEDDTLTDNTGQKWNINEARMESATGTKLNRLPAHRAFWFGWVSAHPDTELVK